MVSSSRPATVTRPRPDLETLAVLRDLRRGCTDDHGRRLLRRLPNESERALLVRRQHTLEIAATPGDAEESAVAVAQMLSGFPSYRSGDGEAEITLTQYAHALREFPIWAIRSACDEISRGKLAGDEAIKLNPAFPPSAEQICIVTRREVRAMEHELAEVREVLAGKIEDGRPRPTQAEIEAKLGRPIGHGRPPSGRLAPIGPPPRGDGGHAARVAADLAARKTSSEQLREDAN